MTKIRGLLVCVVIISAAGVWLGATRSAGDESHADLERAFLADARESFTRADLGIVSGAPGTVERVDLRGSYPGTELVVEFSLDDPGLFPHHSIGWTWALWDLDEAEEDQLRDLDPVLAEMNLIEDISAIRSGHVPLDRISIDGFGRAWV